MADDLASPSGAPWWQRLAECGGLTLALRDEAVEAKKPSAEVAQLTVRMNAYLDAAWHRLAKDRGLEESPSKRTVYRTAGAHWQSVKDNPGATNLAEGESACARDLEAHKKL